MAKPNMQFLVGTSKFRNAHCHKMVLPLGKGKWDVIWKSIGKKAVGQIRLKPPVGARYGSVPISLTFAMPSTW